MYKPSPWPTNPDGSLDYLVTELHNISEALLSFESGMVTLNLAQHAPSKPRAGMMINAAAGVLGVNEGVYRYNSAGAWVFVG